LIIESDCGREISSKELWIRVASVNDPPEFNIIGNVLRQILIEGSAVPIQAEMRSIIGKGIPRGSTAWLLSDLAERSKSFFLNAGGIIEIIDDDSSDLLQINMRVLWEKAGSTIDHDQPQIGLSLACAFGDCGVLHFAQRLGEDIGSGTGAHSSIRFLASADNANLALSALRVVAIGDALGCWRSKSDFDTSRNATLEIQVIDSGRLRNTLSFPLRVKAPKISPLSLELKSSVLQTRDDGILLSGLQVTGGISTGVDCAPDSVVEVSIRAEHGDFVISANLAELGISAELKDSGEYTFRGARSAIARLFGEHGE